MPEKIIAKSECGNVVVKVTYWCGHEKDYSSSSEKFILANLANKKCVRCRNLERLEGKS